MRIALMIARYILGLVFFVFGLNGFFHFIPFGDMPDAATAYMGALMATGYFFPVLKGTEVVCGALLLAGRFVPLALVVLAPIVVQILLFHIFLEPGGTMVSVVWAGLEIFLAWGYRDAFAGVLAPNASPSV